VREERPIVRTRLAIAGRAGHTIGLEVVRPEGRGPFPALIDVHGGAWSHFGPEVDFVWCEGLARRGLAMISVRMRLAPEHPFPACFEDVRDATRWVRAHARELAIDHARLGVIGGSTGGHLALLLGLDPPIARSPTKEGDPEGRADLVVALWPVVDVPARYRMVSGDRRSGPIDEAPTQERRTATRTPDTARLVRALRSLEHARRVSQGAIDPLIAFGQRLVAWLGERALAREKLYLALRRGHEGAFADEAAMAAASPAQLVREGRHAARPPVLIVEGARDPNLVPGATAAFAATYRARGGCATYERVPSLGHSYGNVPGPDADRLIERVARWLERSWPAAQRTCAASAARAPEGRGW
jgi:acetyl esterase/lipase